VRSVAIEQASDPRHPTLRLRAADRIVEPPEPQTREKIRKVARTVLDGDDLDDLEASSDLAHHDAVLRLALDSDDELPAVAQIPRLREVLERRRADASPVEKDQEPEDLNEHGSRALRERAHVVGRSGEEPHPP
jgi:hypothetical protein